MVLGTKGGTKMKTKIVEFHRITKPVRDWLVKNYDPHTSVIIDAFNAKMVKDELSIPFTEGHPWVMGLKQPITMKEARLLKNVSVQEVADFVGVSYHTIGKWEGGYTTPDVDLFAKLLEFYGLKWGELLWE